MKKKILFIESGQYGGGSFNALLSILKYIDRNRFEPYVLYFNKTKHYKLTKDLNIKTYLYDDLAYTLNKNILFYKIINILNLIISKLFPYFSILFEKIIHYKTNKFIDKIIINESINLIHCNVQLARDFFVIFSSIKNNIPIINFIRSPKTDLMNTYKSKFINQHITKIVPVSKSIKELWEKKGIHSKKFQVIYDGISKIDLKKINYYEFLNINDDHKYYFIGCVGRFVKGKGQEILIEACKELKKIDNFKFKLILIGNGPNLKIIKNDIQKNNLSNEIFFLDYIDNAVDHINSFDLLILPSSIDVCSNVLLESLYCETLTIAHAAGGNPEIIIDDYNGLLFYDQNVNELKDKITNILKFDKKHYMYKKNGKELLNKNFLIDKNIKLIEDIYNKYL